MRSASLLFLVLFALGFLPLLGGPRYEAALVAGLLAPGWAAISVALGVNRRLWLEGELSGGELVRSALAVGLLHVGAVFLAATATGLRLGFCEPADGYALMALGPSVGILAGSAWGTLIALIGRRLWGSRPGLLVLGAVLGPLGSIGLRLGEFYASPSVYAFDTFAGYFGGPLYDTIVYDLGRLSRFRAGTALWLLSAGLLARGLRFQATWVGVPDGSKPTVEATQRPRHSLSIGLSPRGGGWLVGAGLAFGLAAPAMALADRWGLRTTQESLGRALPEVVEQGPCQVRFSLTVPRERARLLARECAGHLAQIRGYFGLTGPSLPVQVLLFDDADSKWWHVGARTTYIAKPWRREIYLQNEGYPHPVLGHELAHVVAGEFGAGPLRVAGNLGGLIPDPGRIEGFAVAAAPGEQGDATNTEWASAMLALDVLPSARSLFSLGFLGESAARSYTASGAFVEFLHEKFGPDLLRRFYSGADLEQLTSRSWSVLDREFRSSLAARSLPPHVKLLAEEVFSRPAVWGRRCPHAAARKLAEANAACGAAPEAVAPLVTATLALDSTRQDERILGPLCLAQGQRDDDALREAESVLLAPNVSQRAKSRLRATLADLRWRRGQLPEARGAYESLLGGPLTLPERRAIQIKLWALEQPPPVGERIARVLAQGGHAPGEPPRLEDLERFWSETDEPVFGYLLGLFAAETDPERSRVVLEQVVTQPLPSEDLREEAYRRLLIVSCRSGEPETLARARAWLLRHAAQGTSRLLAEKLPARCG